MTEDTTKNNSDSNITDCTDSSASIDSIPQKELLSNERSMKKECSTIGRYAAEFQLEMFLPGNLQNFILKKENTIPFLGIYQGDGNFDLIRLENPKDDFGEDSRNERGNKIWEQTEELGDGLYYIDKNPGDWFIIPAVMDIGLEAEDCLGSFVIPFETDDASIEEQWLILEWFFQVTGIKPALVIFSGNKSLHVYFWLTEQVTPEVYQRLKRKAIVCFNSDTAIQNHNREMRFAGSFRPAKGTYQEVQYHHPENRVEPATLEQALDKFGNLIHGLTEARWKKYNSARFTKSSKEKIVEIIATPEDLLNPQRTPTKKISTERRIVNREKITELAAGVCPLEIFLGKENREVFDNGIPDGGRNVGTLKLANTLLTHAAALDDLGIEHTDAYDLILEFNERSEPPLDDTALVNAWNYAAKGEHSSNLDDEYYLKKYRRWCKEQGIDFTYEVDLESDLDDEDSGFKKPTKSQIDRAAGLARWNESRKFTGATTVNVARVSDGVPTSDFDPRAIVAIKSGLGTGKTFWMRLLINNLAAGALILGYRNLLGIQTAKLLAGYHIHRNADAFTSNMNNPNAVLSFCVDSLLKFKGNEQIFKNRPVVIDELMSFRKHLLISTHIAPSVRNQCLQTLEIILKICGNIILLDGHISDLAVNWIHELAGTDRQLCKYNNEHPAKQKTVNFIVGTYTEDYDGTTEFDSDVTNVAGIIYDDHSAVESMIVKDKDKFYVHSDNKAQLQSIYTKLTPIWNKDKILLVCADTSTDPNVIAFIENPNEELEKKQYQAVLVSPSGDTGLDISKLGYFKNGYFMFNGVVDASSAFQGTARPRDPEIIYWVSIVKNSIAGKRDDTYDVEATKKQYVDLFSALYDQLPLTGIAEYNPQELFAKVLQQFNSPNGRAAVETSVQVEYERRNIRECFDVLTNEANHKINYIALPEDTNTHGELKDIKDSIKDKKSE